LLIKYISPDYIVLKISVNNSRKASQFAGNYKSKLSEEICCSLKFIISNKLAEINKQNQTYSKLNLFNYLVSNLYQFISLIKILYLMPFGKKRDAVSLILN